MNDSKVLHITMMPEDCMTREDTDKIGDVLGNICLAIREKAPVENDTILLLVAIEMLRKMLADFGHFEAQECSIVVHKTDEEFDELVAATQPPKKGPLQ